MVNTASVETPATVHSCGSELGCQWCSQDCLGEEVLSQKLYKAITMTELRHFSIFFCQKLTENKAKHAFIFFLL